MIYRRRSCRDDRRERGAALVEAAIIIPIFFLLIFGMIEFGVGFNDYVAVRNGARQGARLGVVNDLTRAPSCKIAGSTVTPPMNPATLGDGTNALVCKTKQRVGLGGDVKVQIIRGANPGDSLQVCASFPVKSITGFTAPFISGTILRTSTTIRLEQTPKFADFSAEGSVC
jgi:hypothetical protein